ncbi:methyl-accepting chemotaxis protein [Clostridium sp. LY3-2]|uniref:methyl-accepting chemotaxis protein n=1 Tax=Clostridium sp. LY3-2 TaxID=2942482 RepID=UPI0021539841|nr:methyl-accepting chemotaxis protein [Clostridium sp. LY3-2]MCR6513798.1 methyl-accepting chemotaxis protein [Clostridium sp. LY3-2]
MGKVNKKRKGLRYKILVYAIPIAIICNVIFGFIAYNLAKNSLIKNSSYLMTEIANKTSEVIDENIQSNINSLKIMAEDKEINSFSDKAIDELKAVAKSRGDIAIGLSDINGDAVYTDGFKENIKDQEIYKVAIQDKVYIRSPHKDEVTGKNIVTYSLPVKKDNKVVGVIVCIRSSEDLDKVVKNVSFLDTGSAFVTNNTGEVVESKDDNLLYKNFIKDSEKDNKFKELSEISNKMIKGESGSGTFTLNGEKMYSAYTPIKGSDMSINVYVNEDNLLKELSGLRTAIIVIIIVIIIGVILAAVYVSGRLTKNLKIAKNELEKLSKGNLKGEIDESLLNENDEIGDIARSLRDSERELSKMISEVKESAEDMEENSTSLAAISEELMALTSNISTAINDVAEGTNSQAGDLTEIVGRLDEFGKKINSMNDDILRINDTSLEITNNTKNSFKELEELVSSINEFDSNFGIFNGRILEMGDEIKKVNEITELINSIAEQTNLLALNAAIEAARAGESGKGFAVVAEEIRNLAEQSKDSSENINKIISKLITGTENIVKGTNLMSKQLKQQRNVVDSSMNAFKNIEGSVNTINPMVEGMKNGFESINSDKSVIIRSIEEISAVSEEVAASAEEISASTDELNKSSNEVAISAQKLSERATDTKDNTAKFEI